MRSGRWARSTRSSQLPANWPALRAATRTRAGGRCEHVDDGVRCIYPGAECDHIDGGDDHRPTNLQWLCTPHHRAKSAREGVAARPSLYRPPEQHPALD